MINRIHGIFDYPLRERNLINNGKRYMNCNKTVKAFTGIEISENIVPRIE